MEIVITQPCLQNYNKMIPTGNGRHCTVCNKVVVDFTRMAGAEIIAYFEARKTEETCGRFKCGQVRNNSPVNNWFYKQKPGLARAPAISFKVMAFAAVTWLLSMTGCFMGARHRPGAFEDRMRRHAVPIPTAPYADTASHHKLH